MMTAENQNYEVCVVEDDPLVSKGLTSLLEQKGFSVQSFATGHQIQNETSSLTCCCVLLDINLPDIHGLDVLRKLRSCRPDINVIMITGQADIPTAVKAMQHGALDFIEKPPTADRLIEAIDRSLQLSKQEIQNQPGDNGELRPPLDKLTTRELEVLVQLVKGHQHKMIAHELGISHRTVEVHRARIMKRCGANSFAELIRIAVLSGLQIE